MKCKHCGKEFVQRKINHLYCCKQCRYEDIRKKTEKVCVGCNKPFFPTHQNQQYCCVECRTDFHVAEHVKPIAIGTKHKNTTKELILYSKEARKAGMSYGQYVAREIKIERKR